MSKAYICDRCGRITQFTLHEIWACNPFVMASYGDGNPEYHLCDECFEDFKKFFKNLNGEDCNNERLL